MNGGTGQDGPDLVVAGAGGGLVAAARAAQLGLTVLVVDASEHFASANNTAMSTAMVPGAGTRWQSDAGVDDSPDIFVDDLVRKTHGEVDRRLATALAEVSAPLVTWLADDLRLPMSLVTDFRYPGHSRLRCHTVPGRSGRRLLAGLIAATRRTDRVDLLVPARLTEVDAGPDGVRAVVVTDPNGVAERIPTRAALLATNGYGASRELVREHIPEIADAVYHGSAESTGDALRIGGALGADTAFLDAYQGHAALAVPAGTLVGWATVMHGGFLVDERGRRFGDETVGYSEFAREVLAHAGGRAVLVFDRRVHDACLAFDDFRDTVESGALRWADDPRTLAAAVGVDPNGLAATLTDVAALAEGVGRDRFGRTAWEGALKPPYAAVRVAAALFHTQGGLRVDGHARVLTPSGSPIRGLYASGGAAMGISGHGAGGYLAGNGLLPALGLAFLAARDVAAHRPGARS
ncbi:MAG TPA: FAD-binding protein [Micromonosporaceae bacterium]